MSRGDRIVSAEVLYYMYNHDRVRCPELRGTDQVYVVTHIHNIIINCVR